MACLLGGILGHDEIIRSLLAAIRMDRLPSTLLFVGPHGIGKKTVALGLGQALLCTEVVRTKDENNLKETSGFKTGQVGASSERLNVDMVRACGVCPHCVRVEKGENESLLVIQATQSMIRLETSREILRFLSLARLGSARVVVIDEANTMNAQAANALLKVLEEPPPRTHFFLLAPSLAGILPTLRSRAQIVRMRPLSIEILKKLRPGGEEWVYQNAQGSLATLDLLQNAEWGAIRQKAIELWVSFTGGSLEKSFSIIADITRDRESSLFIIHCWQSFLRDVWVLRTSSQMALESSTRFLDFGPWESLSNPSLNEITRSLWEMESLLFQNMDRQVLFESSWLRVHGVFEKEIGLRRREAR